MKLKKELRRAMEDQEVEITFVEMNDDDTKRRYRIQNVPALIMDDTVVSEGKVLTQREISRLINQNLCSNAI